MSPPAVPIPTCHVAPGAPPQADSFTGFFSRLFDTDFVPRQECYQLRPEVIWLHLVSDGIITLAYYSIPVALIYLVVKRRDLLFNWMFILFGGFILACGTTHLMNMVAIHTPVYRLDGVIKAATALISIGTAIALWPLIPKALAVPSPEALRAANRRLEAEVAERQAAERALQHARDELEARVAERTAELGATNTALRLSEERYRSLVAATSSIVWSADASGRFATPQESWADYTGQPWEEHRDHGWTAAVHPDDRERVRVLFDEAIRTQRRYEAEGRLWCARAGGYRYFHARGVPLLDGDGSVREWVGTVADVHDRALAERAVVEANAQLEQRVRGRTAQLQDANRELEAFSYSVSHDLRAPLRHIAGFAELLERRIGAGQVDETTVRYVRTIADAARRGGRLVDALLAFAQMRRTDLLTQRVDMRALAHEVWQEFGPAVADRSVGFSVGDLPDVRADATMMRLVWQNLLGNALKYTAKRETPRIAVEARRGESETIFSVRDNGIGFEPEYAEKVFRPFTRLHSSSDFEGTGIGLANVQRVVARHGGRVWAEAARGEGATFYFTIPDAPPAQEP